MIGELCGCNSGESYILLVAVVYLALVLFGIAYNAFTAWMERRGYLHGYVSLAVAFGVLVTVGATVLISPLFSLLTVGAFVASGTPMIVGSVWRHVRDREVELAALRREAQDGDAP